MTTYTVTTTANETYNGGDLTAESADGTGLSFNEAAGLAGDGDTITFDAGLIGQSILHSAALFTAVGLTIDGDLDDDGLSDITLDSDAGLRFQPGASATIDGMTITGVTHNIPVLVDNATLVVTNSIFTGNSDGGDVVPQGIYSDNSSLTIQNSRFENSFGPSLVHVNGGTASFTDSSFTNNSAVGLIVGTGSNVTVSNTVFAHNTAANVHVYNGTATITDSILTGSTFRDLQLEGTAVATFENSIIAGANTSISNLGTSYSLTFNGTNIVANGPGVTYSGTAPTVEPTLTNIFAGVTGNGGTLSALTTSTGASIYTALVNPTGSAQGLGVAYAADIGGTSANMNKAAGSTSGTLTISDDNGAAEESFNASSTAGIYGSFSLAAGGAWTYTLNTNNAAVKALEPGETLVDTINVTSADGTVEAMTITIAGSSNAPTVPVLTSDGVFENAPGAFVGTLSASDEGGVTFTVNDDRFVVVGNKLFLADDAVLDFETEPTVHLGVTARDSDGHGHAAYVTVEVLDVNEVSAAPSAGNDVLSGGNHYGRAGDDMLTGGSADDRIGGGADNDTLSGLGGDDTLFGGQGNDWLRGGADDDILYGGAGDDTVDGGAGDDRIWAGAGDDTLTGGTGADTFIFGAHSGNDTITDFSISEDTLNLSFAGIGFTDVADVQAAATAVSGGILIDLGTAGSVILEGLSLNDIASMNLTV